MPKMPASLSAVPSTSGFLFWIVAVGIGQATKKTVGTVTATNSGDVACYLTLKDGCGVV